MGEAVDHQVSERRNLHEERIGCVERLHVPLHVELRCDRRGLLRLLSPSKRSG